MSILFYKSPLFLLPRGCCSSLHRMERRSRGRALMAGEERQNGAGSLCRLCWDGPPAPKEAFPQPPLVLSELPGEAARREQPKCPLSASLHWLWGTATHAIQLGREVAGFLEAFSRTLDLSAIPFSYFGQWQICCHFIYFQSAQSAPTPLLFSVSSHFALEIFNLLNFLFLIVFL